MMKVFMAPLIAIIGMTAGCETTKGVGRDIENTGSNSGYIDTGLCNRLGVYIRTELVGNCAPYVCDRILPPAEIVPARDTSPREVLQCFPFV